MFVALQQVVVTGLVAVFAGNLAELRYLDILDHRLLQNLHGDADP